MCIQDPCGGAIYCSSRSLKVQDQQDAWTLTKADLIEEVSGALKLTTRESAVIVQSILGSMVKALRTGEKIEIRGFGNFHTRQRGPRTGRNPKNGQRVAVPAKTIPYFRPSKEVRALINNSAVFE